MKSPSLPLAFNIMVKPRGPICNLDCQYCYFLKKERLFPNSSFRMTYDLLETFTQQYIESQPTQEITFIWQGGEPTLMGLDFYKQAVALQRKHTPQGRRVQNAIQTNGTQLNDDWARFFKQNHFLVGISIDGPEEIHNTYRVNKGGEPSFKQVMQGLRTLKRHQVDFNVLTTVHAANAEKPLEVYRFLRDEVKTQFIQFIPIVELDEKGSVTSRSIHGEQYGRFLIKIFDEWVHRDVGKVYVQLFDNALGKWLGIQGGLCIFEEICGRAMVLEHNGDLFSCDHFVDPKYKLGNISKTGIQKLASSKKQNRFRMDKLKSLPRYCLECEVRFACNGGCPKNRIIQTPNGKPGLNYLCQGYKMFYKHMDRPMKIMADLYKQKRSLADVKTYLSN
jgi:uncharacterized protein